MKEILLMILLIPSIAYAQFDKSQKVVLLDNPSDKIWIGSIQHLVDFEEDQNAQLVGQARIVKLKDSKNSLIQVVWTGLNSTLDPKVQVVFKKPMISVFKTDKVPLKINQQVPISGDPLMLLEAIEHLHSGKLDEDEMQKKKTAYNPKENGRHVLTNSEADLNFDIRKNNVSSKNKIGESQSLKNTGSKKREINAYGSNRNLGKSNVQGTNGSFGQSDGTGQDATVGSGFDNGASGIDSISTDTRNNGQLTNISRPTSAVGNNIPLSSGISTFGSGSNAQQSSRQSSLREGNTTVRGSMGSTPASARNSTQATHRLGSPSAAGNSIPLGSGTSSSGFRSGVQQSSMAASDIGISSAQRGSRTGVNNSEPTPQATRVADSAFQLGDVAQAAPNAPAEEEEEPEITHDITEEGCRPRIDRVHERIIIQNRCKRLANGVVQDEGECSDSLEMYPIMKDYLCESCTDEINTGERKAYSRYQEYWFDRDNNRHNIGEAVYVDTSRPYPFIDEPSNCAPAVDLEAGMASRQIETVYYNFNNTRKVVQECHASANAPRIPIIQTTEGCGLVHDFPNSISFEQKRSVFTIDGVQHEVLPCHQVGQAITHEFVETGCRPFVNLSKGSMTKMVRRKIQTSKGSKFITDECEPAQSKQLSSTREGCEGNYLHDLVSSCSYLRKRYYFPMGAEKKFVSPCIRSESYLPHQAEINGYQHNDETRASIPKLALYIEGEEGKIIIDPAKVRGSRGEVPYTFVETETRATGESYFEGCFRRIRTRQIHKYERPDGTKYEHNVGPGDPILMKANECSSRTESRNVVIGHKSGSFWKHGNDIWGTQHRTITTYPDGREEAGVWH